MTIACTFCLGPAYSSQTFITEAFLLNYDVGVVSYGATADLPGNLNRSLFLRTNPSDNAISKAIVELLGALN